MLRLFLFPRLKSCSASVLIVTLWAFVILSIFSLGLGNFVFQQIRLANFVIRSGESVPLAKAAVLRSFLERKEDKTPDYDSWIELTKENNQVLCGSGSYTYCFTDKKNINGKEQVIDESGLININYASPELLKRLPGLNDEIAEAILNSSRRPFALKEELLFVDGIDDVVYNQFKDLITVYGSGKVNINTASEEALSVLGLDSSLIQLIISYRKEYPGQDGQTGTEDDGAFTAVLSIISGLNNFSGLSPAQEESLTSILSLLTVKSEYLRLNVTPQVRGKPGIKYSIIMHPAGNKIVAWSES